MSVRSFYARRLELQQKITDVLLLATAVLLAVATFMDRDLPPKYLNLDADAFMVLMGILGIANFAVAVLLLYLRPGPKGDLQRAARRYYTEINREVKRALDTTQAVDEADLERRFLADTMFPDVPDNLFLIYKARHIRKISVSRLLDQGLSLKEAMRRVRLREKGEPRIN